MKKKTPNIEIRLKSIEKSVFRIENILENFAISVKNQFDVVEQKLDTKADKKDIAKLERFFTGHENRLLRIEDNMQVVRTKLKFKG